MDKIKVLLIEDQDLLLDGMALSLNTDPDLQVVGKFKDIEDYFLFPQKGDVDILLTDICTANGHNSLDYVQKIKHDNPEIKVVLMTSVMEIDFIERAKLVNADSFVYKSIPTQELITVIKNVIRGYATFPLSKKEELTILKDLSENEMKIIRLFCQGNNRKEIAEIMSFSEHTIKNYITQILEKTEFSSMSKLAIWLTQKGYIA